MKIAIFPGSFDPIHEGHISIIKKASKLFDKLYVIVSFNKEKLYVNEPLKKRYSTVEKVVNSISLNNVYILLNENKYIADIAKEIHANYIVRSARTQIDYKYEIELAAANNYLNNKLETILIIPSYSNINFASRLLKQRGIK